MVCRMSTLEPPLSKYSCFRFAISLAREEETTAVEPETGTGGIGSEDEEELIAFLVSNANAGCSETVRG